MKLHFTVLAAVAAGIVGCGGGRSDPSGASAPRSIVASEPNTIITSESARVDGEHSAVSAYLARSERALQARSPAARMSFDASVPVAGFYRLYVWWPQALEGSGEAWVTVRDAAGEVRVAVDQSRGGGQWQSIGVFRSDGGSVSVTLSSRGAARVVADAIRLHRQDGPPELAIETDALPIANEAAAYHGELTAVGRPPFRWSVAEGALPDGLTLDAETGRIQGVPARPGSYDVTLAVRDASGQEGRKAFSMEVDVVRDVPPRRPTPARERPATVGSDSLLDLLDTIPENGWVKANLNAFSDVWTPADLRPLKGLSNPPPSKIIEAWSSFGWDSNRSWLWLYGGGHANYHGNDMYRFDGATRLWVRASLPSEVKQDDLSNMIAVDGPFLAPTSAHTYDNGIFLPAADRYLTFGGAVAVRGGSYKVQTGPSTDRNTGPYFFDPTRADGDKVGGSTGSHVQRVAAFPGIQGGLMWENRDLWGNLPAGTSLPASFVSGCTAYDVQDGKETVYVAARSGSTALALYKYTLRDLADPRNDTFEQVGRYWAGTTDQTTCGYDPVRKVLLRTGSNTIPLLYWDLATPGPSNKDIRATLTDPTGEFTSLLAANTLRINRCAMEFDRLRQNYILWCGDGRIWRITPPAGAVSPSGWTITKEPAPVGATPNGDVGTGVLGKWRYAPELDAFVGLQDPVQGNVWLYKPVGWQRPAGGGGGGGGGGTPNQPPQVQLTSPAQGQTFAAGAPVTLDADASDTDGSIARVEFYSGAVKIGEDADGAPYTYTWTNAPTGTLSLTALAVDDDGAGTLSAAVTVTVAAPPPQGGATIVLQDGRDAYASTSDTYLSSYHPSLNFGTAVFLQDQQARYSNLLRFAIFQSEGGPVPDTATIQSAKLSVYKSTSYNVRYGVHPLLVDWLENASTWSQRLPGTAWAAPGARGPGTDHATTADAVADAAWDPGWVEFDVTGAVARFGTVPASNRGWIMLAQSGYVSGLKKFHTAESAVDPALRPKLEVTYHVD